MSDDILARVDAALEGVTHGPWKLGNRRYPDVVHTPHGCLWHPDRGDINDRNDGEFVAAARTLVPELRDEVATWMFRAGQAHVNLELRDAEIERLLGLQRDDQQNAIAAIAERDAALAEVERMRADHDPGRCFHCTRCADADDSQREGYKLARAEVERLKGALEAVEARNLRQADTIDRARFSLGAAWDDGNACGLDGWIGPGRGAGEVDDEAIRSRERCVDKLLRGDQ